jgi:hypothetical protein
LRLSSTVERVCNRLKNGASAPFLWLKFAWAAL